MGGTSTRNFKMFRKLCGDTALQNVVIVTNMWGEVTPDVGEAREEQLKTRDIFFKPALDKGAHIRRHDNTSTSAQAIIHCIAFNNPLVLCIQRELVDEQKDIAETAAGAALGRELHEQAMRYQAERRRLQDELNEGFLSLPRNSVSPLNMCPLTSVRAERRGGSRRTRASDRSAEERHDACANRFRTPDVLPLR